MKNKGFTLVELLAVIAILAILVIMALPAVLRMFNQARIDIFSNEVNTIIRTTRQQYLLGGGEPQSFNSSSNKLPLTGNSNLEYCVSIDGNGEITELKATNGNYKYESSGTVDEVHSTEVSTAESNYELSCAGGNTSSITYVNRQNEGSITVGDEIAIDTEHFYVISSDETETALLAKYNLYVGDIFTYDESAAQQYNYIKTLSSNDIGYGLQNSSAIGSQSVTSGQFIGVVPFSGTNYWNGKVGSGLDYPGQYCTSMSETNCANVYDSSKNTTSPLSNYDNGYGVAQDNGYTIAYYIKKYLDKLKDMGAPSSITGRLMTLEEAYSIHQQSGTTLKNNLYNGTYWLGSVYTDNSYGNIYVWGAFSNGTLYWISYYSGSFRGVRPVIEVPTSSMP